MPAQTETTPMKGSETGTFHIMRMSIVAENEEDLIKTLELAAKQIRGKQWRGEFMTGENEGGGIGGGCIDNSISRYTFIYRKMYDQAKWAVYHYFLGGE